MSVQSVCGEHMSCFCVGISDKSRGWVRYHILKQWMFSPQTVHVVVLIHIYYAFDVDLVDVL